MKFTGPFLFACLLAAHGRSAELSDWQDRSRQPLFGAMGGARAMALGGAFQALAQGREALFGNPAGLGSSGMGETGLDLGMGPGALSQGTASLAIPLGSGFGLGAWGHGSDYGGYVLRDASGQSLGQVAARDSGVGLSAGLRTQGGFSFGLGARGIRQGLPGQPESSAGLDLGLGWVAEDGWTAGASVSSITLGDNPRGGERLRWSIGRQLFQGETGTRLMPAFGFSWVSGGGGNLHLGWEWTLQEAWALRAGYQWRFTGGPDPREGLSLGLGWRRRWFGVDYGIVPMGGQGTLHALSFVWRQEALPPIDVKPAVKIFKLNLPQPPRPPLTRLQTKVDLLATAKALENEGRIEEAADAYERVTLEYPDLLGAWRGLADLRFRLGQNLAALSAYRQVLLLDPDPDLKEWVEAYRRQVEAALP